MRRQETHLARDSSQGREEWARSPRAAGACEQERTGCRGPSARHRLGPEAGHLLRVRLAEAGRSAGAQKADGAKAAGGRWQVRPCPGLSLFWAGGQSTPTRRPLRNATAWAGAKADALLRTPSPGFAARTKPASSLAPAPGPRAGRRGHQAITEPRPARIRRLRSRGPAHLRRRAPAGRRGGRGPGG